MFGMLVGRVLSEHHVTNQSKGVIMVSTGVIRTLTALALGRHAYTFPTNPNLPTVKIHRILTAASLAGILNVIQLPAVGMAAEGSPSPKTAATNPYIEQPVLAQLKRMSETLGAAKALTFLPVCVLGTIVFNIAVRLVAWPGSLLGGSAG
jgi:hypothetical protein